MLAKNANGIGPTSEQSGSVTLPNVPAQPTITNIDPTSTSLAVTYQLGADEGSSITGVRAKCLPSVGSTKKKSAADPR